HPTANYVKISPRHLNLLYTWGNVVTLPRGGKALEDFHGEKGFRGEERRCGMIVVGDPDRQARERAAVALRRSGFELMETATGVKTRDDARRDGVELVLLEIAFPDMSGYEICRELRTEYGDGLPIIFVSGTRTEPIDRVAGLLIGGDDFIVKPFDCDELVARV